MLATTFGGGDCENENSTPTLPAASFAPNRDPDGIVGCRRSACQTNFNGYYSLDFLGSGYETKRCGRGGPGAALWSSTGRGQQASRILRVLELDPQDAVRANFAPAKARMTEVGFIEGQIFDDWMLARPTISKIVCPGWPETWFSGGWPPSLPSRGRLSAAKAATTFIPIIFSPALTRRQAAL